MRIIHLISGLSAVQGGTAAAVALLAKAQHKAGLDVRIATTFIEPPDATAQSLRDVGVQVTEIGPCRRLLQRHPSLKTILRQEITGCDVVHIHALWEEIQHQGAVAARSLGVPYVITPHGMLDPWSLAQSRLRKRVYLALRMRNDLNRAAAIHCTSSVERDLAASLNLKPPAIVEPNGVDLSEFEHLPARGAFRAKHPGIGDRPIVLFLSRVHPKKGLDLLIPAFAAAEIPRAVLVIAGPDSGGYANQVRIEANQAGLGDRVIFTGMLRGQDRLEPMVDADLFVLPSYQENFGIAVVEALAAACPVVISDQVNIHAEVSTAGVGGVVPTQIKPLADALRLWMSDATMRADVSAKGPQFVRERYDWDQIAVRWCGHYAKLIGGRT